MPGQRSFDAARLFGRRPRERGEPRRAVSEDQRNEAVVDNQRPLASDERGQYLRDNHDHVARRGTRSYSTWPRMQLQQQSGFLIP